MTMIEEIHAGLEWSKDPLCRGPWSGLGKKVHELTPIDTENLWHRAKKWIARRMHVYYWEQKMTVREAVTRACNESGLKIDAVQMRAIEVHYQAQLDQDPIPIDAVSKEEYEQEISKAEREGYLISRAKPNR